MIIAVDGPAASGKGTIARALARHYDLPHLDTGLLYRAVAATVLRHELNPAKEADAVAACDFDDLLLADPALRDDEIGKVASIVSAHPLVRAALLQRQKRFAAQEDGAVLDGRDIGTVIAPNADAKLFVKATPTIRARRRHAELHAHGSSLTFDQVLADIRARDQRDSTRSTAPLVAAEDAATLDTSFLSIEAAVQKAIDLVEAARARKAAAGG
ncbi:MULTISPECIES: (d)CMP kinase [unclassified Sphingomonas]|uniref:(d)CMP kinase n=1 Tax=unclassified Sphingomonas TaxID=196159 RepID=UPI000928917D|nr:MULTISPECIES: (d)CMP kinase [unclassified Sphingomonas]OJU17474.1 MAG: cytidylate kinase [Sphingomonas sp. 66-10]